MATKKKEEAAQEVETEAVEKTESAAQEAVAAEAKPEKTTKAKSSDKKEDKPKKAAKPKKEAAAKKSVDAADKNVADGAKSGTGKRSEKVGIVFSDKMMKSVVVRVDRVVKHPMYHKYMKRRKKFMAHDELGAAIGDRVRIVETRPLSAKKRWRVVEIIQKAEK